MRGEFAQQDIVNSEQPDAGAGGDLGEPDIGDSGITFVDNRRMRASLRPSVSFDVSQRNELQFGVGYTDVSYERQMSECAGRLLRRRSGRGACDAASTRRSSLITRLRGARYDIESQEATNGLWRRARMEPAHGRGYAQLSSRGRAERGSAER